MHTTNVILYMLYRYIVIRFPVKSHMSTTEALLASVLRAHY